MMELGALLNKMVSLGAFFRVKLFLDLGLRPSLLGMWLM